ncbi:MAG: LysM peptidoglycan-binding domain-containing protein, partial [Chitinivibrionales bacterium]|nr:LysM peptidoglycan-binding domain-containing protein [Chitinivibrionales bacterium]
IESGFSPFAYSFAHAAGLWQFIEPTGKHYGLRINYWLDERRDPIKSTRAAISYLKKLYNQFENWYLALAAYNCGENNIQGAMTRSNTGDYWKLSLHRETMGYVPQFIAALMIAKSPSCFGFTSGSEEAFDLDTVSVSSCLDLNAVADSLNISIAELHAMNPHITHWCTPPQTDNVLLYLPAGSGDQLTASLQEDSTAFAVNFYRYEVKHNDDLSSIARRFKVSLPALSAVNPALAKRPRTGAVVVIPIPLNASASCELTEKALPEDFAALAAAGPDHRRSVKSIRYRVRPGDKLSGLAELFHVSARDICRWNKLKNPSRLTSGSIIVLHIPESVGRSAKKSFRRNNIRHREKGAARLIYYRVKRGDTLSQIASLFKTTVDSLQKINNLPGLTKLLPGDIIKVLTEEL